MTKLVGRGKKFAKTTLTGRGRGDHVPFPLNALKCVHYRVTLCINTQVHLNTNDEINLKLYYSVTVYLSSVII